MSSTVLPFDKSVNKLGYPHVVCLRCEGNLFHIEAQEDDGGVYYYKWLICKKCGDHIAVNMQPVWPPGE